MGQIETVEPDGENQKYAMALLIEFDSAEDIRTALKEMECKLSFDDVGDNVQIEGLRAFAQSSRIQS